MIEEDYAILDFRKNDLSVVAINASIEISSDGFVNVGSANRLAKYLVAFGRGDVNDVYADATLTSVFFGLSARVMTYHEMKETAKLFLSYLTNYKKIDDSNRRLAAGFCAYVSKVARNIGNDFIIADLNLVYVDIGGKIVPLTSRRYSSLLERYIKGKCGKNLVEGF